MFTDRRIDDNSAAPTGAGKSVLMELAIIRTLLNNGNDSKIIYMAPTKSLCSERARDWEAKFKPFNIECKCAYNTAILLN